MAHDKTTETLVNALSAHQVFLLSLMFVLHQVGITVPQYASAMRECIQFYDRYKSAILADIENPRPAPRSEKEMWEALGLGDLWGPSTGHEPDEPSPMI